MTSKRTGIIYMITTPEGRYIGRAFNYKRTIDKHRLGYSRGAIGNAIAKHGWHNCQEEILADNIDASDLVNVKMEYIEKLKPELNQTKKDTGFFIHSEETLKKLSNAAKSSGGYFNHDPKSQRRRALRKNALHRRKIAPDIKKAKRLQKKGKSGREIARILGKPYSTVNRWLKTETKSPPIERVRLIPRNIDSQSI